MGESSTQLLELTERDIALFWAKVSKNGPIPQAHPELGQCWIWTGGLMTRGYGVFSRNRKGKRRSWRAHRLAFELTFGEVPDDQPMVRHRCDNPPCCNPDHLIPGTAADNMNDVVSRGRHWTTTRPENIVRGDKHWSRQRPELRPCGEANGNAILTSAQVAEIRKRYLDGGISQRTLAREFSCSQGLIWRILHKQLWS